MSAPGGLVVSYPAEHDAGREEADVAPKQERVGTGDVDLQAGREVMIESGRRQPDDGQHLHAFELLDDEQGEHDSVEGQLDLQDPVDAIDRWQAEESLQHGQINGGLSHRDLSPGKTEDSHNQERDQDRDPVRRIEAGEAGDNEV